MARGRDVVIRSGQVTIEEGGKVYTARYDVLKGGALRLETGQTAHLRGMPEESLARLLLRESSLGPPRGKSPDRPKPQ
jgi:hypothetical protein